MSWDADDQDKALAYQREMAQVCPHCGTRECDWVDDEKRHHTPARLTSETYRCFGCQEMERTRKGFQGDTAGLGVRIVPTVMEGGEGG